MKNKTIKSYATTVFAIVTTSAMLIINLFNLEYKEIEPAAIETKINIQESCESYLVESNKQIVEVQNTNQEVDLFYDIPLSNEDQLQIRDIALKFGIDFELVLAIMKSESEFNQYDIGDNGASLGAMQIQPKWWEGIFNENSCTDWFSLRDNVTVGCAILQYMYSRYEDTAKVLNAYNSNNPNNYNGYSDKVFNNLVEINNLKRSVVE